jgi:DNA-binding LytR/AlgR family response regulator
MLKIAICEDNNIQRNDLIIKIKHYLNLINKQNEIFEFINGQELILCEEKFNIYFLDIEMDKLSGIDVAKKIRSIYEKAIVIFITGFKDYVFEAFDVKAFHYIMKPIDEKKFKEILYSAVESLTNKEKFILAKTINSSTKILLRDILYIESNRRKIKVHTNDDIIEYYCSLSELESTLLEENFFRCHKSYIVNFKYVKSFDNTSITLKNLEKVYVSKYKLSDFAKAFMYYLKIEEY